MSPILVRPVREQLEHDRVIRLLQAKYKRKFEVAINPGTEQSAPVGGPPPWYPDLVLQSPEKNRKLLGVVEVETNESVNHLEAMSQWAAFGKLRVPFHLYVPAASIDSARRLCADLQIPPAEVWAYSAIGDQMRFTLVQKSTPPADGKDAKDGKKVPAVNAVASAKPAAAKTATKAAAARKAPARKRTAAPPRRAAAAATARRKPAAAKGKSAPARGSKSAGKTATRSARSTSKRR